MPFDNGLLKEIKDKLDLRVVVEQDLGQGQPSGSTLRWACPFHQGHNPTAFSVSKDYFQCWSCEASGDVIAWYMQREQLDFRAALGQAATVAGVPLSEPIPQHFSQPKPRQPLRPVRPLLQSPDLDWQQSNH